MVFDHARNTNTNGGTFNDVHGDHIVNVNNSTSICFLSIKQRCPPCNFSTNLARPICGPKNLSQLQKLPVKSHRSSEAISSVDKAVSCITEIEMLLFDGHRCSNDLKPELESLRQSLMLTKNAMHVYDGRPLGQSLANAVNLEVQTCCAILQKLLDSMKSTLQDLNPTTISWLWSLVWWSWWGEDDIDTLRSGLSWTCRLLDGFLLALHSIIWMDELHARDLSLKQLHAIFGQYILHLGHIKINSVDITDHLGGKIRVPTIFCSTWKDFDYVINGYCKDRAGKYYIERGDYEVISAEDGRLIGRSEFASTVKEDMALEMTIVLRQKTDLQEKKEKCPRCGHISFCSIANSGWSECYKCSGQFQVVIADDIEVDGGVHDDEIISPASRVSGRDTKKHDDGEGLRPHDDNNETQLFRRIHVICMDNNIESKQLPILDLIILVIGQAGAGKSSFINAAAGSNLRVGHNFYCCTKNVQSVTSGWRGRKVVFVDTPAFDIDIDPKGEADLKRKFEKWQKKTSTQNHVVAGIIYLHKISETRITEPPHKRLKTLERLCGGNLSKNVVLVTTMWNDVRQAEGESRERQLRERYWGSTLMTRFDSENNSSQAWSAVELLLEGLGSDVTRN